MSLQKRSVLLTQETDGYATLTDAQQTDAQTDASGSDDDGSAARAAAIEAAAWKRRKVQDERMTIPCVMLYQETGLSKIILNPVHLGDC